MRRAWNLALFVGGVATLAVFALVMGAVEAVVQRPDVMRVLACPLCETPDEAVAWFAERGVTNVFLWLGSDGLVRGHGRSW